MASRANLIATYNANPTLQSQYTLDQYLSLFDFNQIPTTPFTQTPTTTTTPTQIPVTTGLPNIINQNLGGGEGPAAPPGSPSYEYNSTFASTNTTPEENLGYLDDIGEGTIDNVDDDNTFVGKIGNFVGGIGTLFSNLPTPFNLVRKAYEFTQQKELEKKAQEEAIAKDIARDMQEANRAGRTGGYQAGYDACFMDGPSGAGTGNSPSDKGGSDSMGSFQDGGRVYLYNRLK